MVSLLTDSEYPRRDVTAVPSGVDGAVGVPDAKWFVAIVNPRHEKSVADKLLTLNIESYVATQPEVRIWANGRRKTIERVVIPCMVFVRCTEAERRHIVTLPYIQRFLVNRTARRDGAAASPVAVIGDAEMAKLRFMLGNADSAVEFAPTEFRVHDNVRVVRGNLAGLEGEIRANSDGTHTLLVSLALLGGALLHIHPHDVVKL